MSWLTDARSESGTNLWIAVILLVIGFLTFGGSVPLVGMLFTAAGVFVLVRALAQRSREKTNR